MSPVLAEEATSWSLAIGIVVVMAILMFGAGLVAVGVANRTADGRTGRNSLAGIRTSATMSSDEAWYAAHTAGRRLSVVGGWVAVIAGIGSLPIAVVGWLLGLSADLVVAVALAVSTGIGTVGVKCCFSINTILFWYPLNPTRFLK